MSTASLLRVHWKKRSWGMYIAYVLAAEEVVLTSLLYSLQRFKLNIANSVVTQQNSGLGSMDTDLVLDLFRRTTEEEDAAASKKSEKKAGPTSQKNILSGLEDLPPEDEYSSLDLSSFMGSL